MKTNHKFIGLLMSCALLLGSASFAWAEGDKEERDAIDFDKEPVTATLDLKNKSLALILGGTRGGGTLNYQGKTYKFKMKGFSVGGLGYVSIDAVGKVYRLKKLEDFNGRYNAGQVGATVGKGKGGGTLENANGVIIKLSQKSTGLALSMSLSSVIFEFEK
ncbi:MAG TPA: hypothetical protein ENI64_09175 [Gammaproteobacteria bacterium]|nr:hypothetical protein [Gammaproteobacteria bacterium]